ELGLAAGRHVVEDRQNAGQGVCHVNPRLLRRERRRSPRSSPPRGRDSVTAEEGAMKRMHVHVSVDNLERSIGFYSALFAAAPAGVKPAHAKWMLADPRVNFAISTRGRRPGLDHLGIQVESADELGDVYGRLRAAGGHVLEEGATTCCYANSEKSWIEDPSGISWEAFLTTGESTDYGVGIEKEARVAHAKAGATPAPKTEAAACCGPSA